MADLLNILGLAGVAGAKAQTATLEGEQIKREREQKDLLARLAQQRQSAQDAEDAKRSDLLNRLTEAQIARTSAPEPERPRRTQVVDGQLVDLDAGTAMPIQGYTVPPQKPTAAASRTPERGTPEYIAMLEQEAAARAKGGGAERGAQLPASAIEKMIELDDLVAMTTRASKSLGAAVAQGKDVTGRALGVIPVKNWIRNAVGQGGDEGTATRAELANITSSLIKLRSGAAVTTQEFARLEPFLASDDDDESVAMIKLRKLREALEDIKRIRLTNYEKYGKLGNRTSADPIEEDDGETITTSSGRTFQRVTP